MPSITVGNDITFYYTDSGPPSESTYATIFFLHGHTFHSGIFQRLANHAGSRQLRTIAFNRREYPGTTPYDDDERRVVREGSFEDRKSFLQKQGNIIALAVDGLVQELSLPEQITVAGWSLGAALLTSLYCSINTMSDNVQQRLKKSVRNFILLDGPTYSFGIPTPAGGYCPLFGDELSPEQIVSAFGEWCSSYYQHGDLSSRDVAELQLSLRRYDLLRQSTAETMTPAELESTVSLTVDLECDTMLLVPVFRPVLEAQTNTLLFDSRIRDVWGKSNVWCLYGEASVWTCIYASWYLEQRSNEILFKLLRGANHFFMWDDPEKTLDLLKNICTNDDRESFRDITF